MAKLTLYVDKGIRSSAAKAQLKNLEIDFVENNIDAGGIPAYMRSIKSNPMPQYYVGETLAWENGYKDVVDLTAEDINNRVEEINNA